MSTIVENSATIRYTKRNTSQPSLWEEEAPPVPHHHIEVIYLSGHRETYCTANSYRPNRPGDWQWEAGFVGGTDCAEECSICNKREAV